MSQLVQLPLNGPDKMLLNVTQVWALRYLIVLKKSEIL